LFSQQLSLTQVSYYYKFGALFDCAYIFLCLATKVAERLNVAFRTLSGDVVGDERVLFGAEKNFCRGQCCSDLTAFDGYPDQIDLVIALDESGSVGLSNFNIMKTFIKDIVSHFVVSYSATKVALVTWSTSVTLEFDFNEYINNDGVKNGIDGVTYNGGWTATGNALNFIRNNLFSQSSSSATKVLFIITDGRSNAQTHNPVTEAQLLKNSGVEIFAFGIGGNIYDLNSLLLPQHQLMTTNSEWRHLVMCQFLAI